MLSNVACKIADMPQEDEPMRIKRATKQYEAWLAEHTLIVPADLPDSLAEEMLTALESNVNRHKIRFFSPARAISAGMARARPARRPRSSSPAAFPGCTTPIA